MSRKSSSGRNPSRQTKNRLLRPRLRYSVIALLLLFPAAFTFLHHRYPLQVQVAYSPVVTAADGTVLHAFLSPDDMWRMQLEPDEINPVLKRAVLLKEDRYFYYHPGVNPVALGRAVLNNIQKGKTTSGASTITMQVVRLLHPRERTLRNKVLEMFRAVQLELAYSKDEILQLYLNLVPFGGNVEGVKAAAVLYFQQSPKELSLAQAVTLAVIPNKPSSLRIGRQNARIVTFRNVWLRRFGAERAFPADQIADALAEPLVAEREAAPQLAPHFAYRMYRQYPGQPIIKTTLQPQLQDQVERLAHNYLQRLRPQNIHNVSVVVVNNRTRAVEAYLGSGDFRDHAHAGQVDGVRAIRSPGSTLKPFLYATAIDRGLLTPQTIISDVPVDFGGYRPENYFGTYSGNISIETALATSLNVPAVKVLDQVGVQTFVQKLQEAGFHRMQKSGDQLGLSLILGGCDVTLEELTTLYAAFADQGRYRPLRWQQQDTAAWQKKIVSPGAAFMVTQILTTLTRPDLPHNAHNSPNLPKIAWKTGTSYGRKDAWSIGYNQKYTIGVWVGNFSGEGVPELNGTDSATPLLFELFNTADYGSPAGWFSAPTSLKNRAVCVESGLPVNNFCRNQVLDVFLPGVSAVARCEHLKAVPVSADGQFAYCTACLPERGFVERLYPNFAPEILTYFDAAHIPYQQIPSHNPACRRIFQENAPRITSPTADMEYWLERAEQQQLQLRCNAHNEVRQVHWYVNDHFLGTSPATAQRFFAPDRPGRYKISCTDDQGRNTDSYITVKFME